MIPPPGQPSKSPDELSRCEVQEAEEMAALKPAKRVTMLYERQIKELQKRLEANEAEIDGLRAGRDENLRQAGLLRTRLASLETARAGLRATMGWSALAMTVASTVIGVAGFPSGPARWIVLAVGITMFVVGLGCAVLALVRSKPENQ